MNLRQLRNTINEILDLLAEELFNLFKRRDGILNGIVKKCCSD